MQATAVDPYNVSIETRGDSYVGVGHIAGLRCAVYIGRGPSALAGVTEEMVRQRLISRWHDEMSELYGICDICDLHYVLGDATDHNPETGNHHECEAGIIRLGFV